MPEKSFYSLDYIIEINQERLQQYTSAYQKILERLTNIIIIYSALIIFLVPVIQDIVLHKINDIFFFISFGVYVILLLVSILYAIRLIIPVEVAYLEEPKKYYVAYRLNYEEKHGKDERKVDKLLKASYVNELERALAVNDLVFRKKSSFYYNSLMFGLIAAVPYLICLGFHISQKQNHSIQKIEVMNAENIRTLLKNQDMRKDTVNVSNSKKDSSSASSSSNTTSQLPGVDKNSVKPSSPKLIKENSDKVRKKDN